MSKTSQSDTRAQRLAAKLKENLRRRKAQTRARKSSETDTQGTLLEKADPSRPNGDTS